MPDLQEEYLADPLEKMKIIIVIYELHSNYSNYGII